jgi:hypothetical protein
VLATLRQLGLTPAHDLGCHEIDHPALSHGCIMVLPAAARQGPMRAVVGRLSLAVGACRVGTDHLPVYVAGSGCGAISSQARSPSCARATMMTR